MIDFFSEYNVTLLLGTPLVFFVIAVGFRLLDTSAAIFLEHNILVTSSYITTKEILSELEITEQPAIAKSLKKNLIFRRLHNFFMLLAGVSGVVFFSYFVYDIILS